jgi:hypothetical protein
LSGKVHRLLGGTALSIDCDAGYVLRQPRGQPGSAGDVTGLRTDLVDAAEYDILDRSGIYIGSLNGNCHDVRGEVCGVDVC